MRFASLSAVAGVLGLFGAIHCGSSNSRADDFGDNQNVDPTEGRFGGDASMNEGGPVVVDKCHVPADNDNGNAPSCTAPAAPPNSFAPVLKWSWKDPTPGSIGVWTTPLVANLTDDDGDGEVNLCDIPDVIVQSAGSGEFSRSGRLYMLRGTDGMVESNFGGVVVDGDATPAIADLDGDKVPEVIAVDQPGHIIIFDNKGAVKHTGDIAQASSNMQASCGAISVYDLDADGSPEILYGFEVFDSKGKSKWNKPPAETGSTYWCPTPIAADLDGDGKLEVIFGNGAYHADGSAYWTLPGPPGAPQVANLDNDADPEVVIARQDGILVLEHDGKVKFGPVQPFDQGVSPTCWDKPAAIHDFDGDGHADLATSSCSHYGIFNVTTTGLTPIWSAAQPVNDNSGIASSTGFDFLGRGVADAVYGDQVSLLVFDGKSGKNELTQARSSGTIIEFPVVADVDNDASADILVVSNNGSYPSLQVFQDAEKRWIPTRRIWNQHAYHVTNVREDGTIPKVMPKSWTQLNTFRTNAQIQTGGTCAPPPPSPK